MPITFDFTELGLDFIGGTVLGGIAGISEYTIASAVASMPAQFITPALIVPFALITGALVFVGAFFAKVGSKTYKASQTV
jgi:hypothetical protein